jgi:hypothetical protein
MNVAARHQPTLSERTIAAIEAREREVSGYTSVWDPDEWGFEPDKKEVESRFDGCMGSGHEQFWGGAADRRSGAG